MDKYSELNPDERSVLLEMYREKVRSTCHDISTSEITVQNYGSIQKHVADLERFIDSIAEIDNCIDN